MIQLSQAIANARLDAIETVVGTSPILRIRSGPSPANVAAAATGTVLATINLASDWAAAAAAGVKNISDLPLTDSAADATGTAGHWELVQSNGTTRCLQGDVGLTGSGASLILSTLSIIAGSPITILAAAFDDTASL